MFVDVRPSTPTWTFPGARNVCNTLMVKSLPHGHAAPIRLLHVRPSPLPYISVLSCHNSFVISHLFTFDLAAPSCTGRLHIRPLHARVFASLRS